jgi:uncharacterized protein YoxC
MTDSTDQKPTPRTHRLTPNTEDFDFDLVDMHIIPEQTNMQPSPLDHIMDDEDAIDRVLTDARLQTNSTVPSSFAAKESLMPNAQTVPEIKTNFYVDYFDKRKKAKKPPTSAPEVATTSPVNNQANEMDATPPNLTESELALDNHAPVINGSGMAVAILSQFKSKQESINKQQEQLIQEFSGKIKAATTITYTAVFFGVTSLVAAVALGMMLLKTQSELSDLAGTTTALKDDVKNIKALPDDLEGTDPALDQLNKKVEQLNEKIDGIEHIAQSNKTVRSEKKSVAETTVINEATTAEPAAAKTTDKAQVAVVAPEKKPVETAKVTPNAKVGKTAHAEPTSTDTVVANVSDKKLLKATTNNKSSITNIMEKAQDVPVNDINKVANVTGTSPAVVGTHTVTDNSQTKTNQSNQGGWTVNLGSSNKLEDAKRTAASFAQKGIPVSISTATTKDGTRYRLQVKGFKNKEEATAFSNKAKTTLKLNSVWINP